jgi:hypothetical protein
MHIHPLLLLIIAVLVFSAVTALFHGGGGRIYTEEPYDGLVGSDTWKRMYPRAYVVYPPSDSYPVALRSIDMPIGNARNYAKIFGGKVVRIDG